MRTALVVLALVASRQVAYSDGCTDLESWGRMLTDHAHAIAHRYTEASLQCAFSGPDDQTLAALAKKSKSELKEVLAALPKKAVCTTTTFSLQAHAEGVMHTAGERIGMAFAMCSTQAREVMKKLAAKGPVSEDDLQKALDPYAQKYLNDVLPE